MIFVTVGAQMPFDRLVRAVDAWAAEGTEDEVFAQIGPTGYRPSNIRFAQFLRPEEFRRQCTGARAIVAHAGTGSIITALQLGKPIIVMPRRASLRETRSDHQVATAERFRRFSSVVVARDEAELRHHLSRIGQLAATRAIGAQASEELLRAIRLFVEDC